ncbi:MAG: hypothetical protein AAF551_01210, partial [Bacteroidota bacterium]
MEARIENFSTWISGDTGEALRSQVEHLLKESQFTILNFMEHHFEPQGYYGSIRGVRAGRSTAPHR